MLLKMLENNTTVKKHKSAVRGGSFTYNNSVDQEIPWVILVISVDERAKPSSTELQLRVPEQRLLRVRSVCCNKSQSV